MEKKGSTPTPGVIRFERRLHCSVLEAWAWLTESDKRGQWLATGEMELVEGGKVNLHFQHSDLSPLPGAPPDKYKAMAAGQSFTGTVLRIDPPHLLSFTWDGGSEVTFELEPTAGIVLLTLTHRLLPTDKDAQSSVLGGWHTHLDILLHRLDHRTPPNFWTRQTQLEQEYATTLS
jgi:uncharacterized protein YndB with AHSA1/START domain